MQERFHNFGIQPNWGSGIWPLMRDYLNARLPPLWCSVSCPDWRAGPYPILGLALIVNPARFAVSRDLGLMRPAVELLARDAKVNETALLW